MDTQQPWDYVLERKFKEEIGELMEALAAGSAGDYAQYQYICGRIRGIRFAMDTVTWVRERLNRADVTEWKNV